MALIGYARVSSVGQTLAVQLDKLGQCDKVFQEKLVLTTKKWFSHSLRERGRGNGWIIESLS